MNSHFLENCRTLVERKLDELVPSAETEPTRLHEAVRWSLLAGGKRFRPVLLLAVGETFGASAETMLRTAAAVEMVHTYSLVHDDLPAMDDDDLRRGRATCHKKFDEATAILAGDVLQTLAFQAIAEDDGLDHAKRVRLVAELARAAGTPGGMVSGQQFDLSAEGRRIPIEELERIHRSKTGALIIFSARAGAIIAGADEHELSAVSEYAANLGLLFQVTDDLLDVTETTEVLGKTAGKDVSAKKATYPAIYGVEKAGQLAERIRSQAVAALDGLDGDTGLLIDLVEFILKRRS